MAVRSSLDDLRRTLSIQSAITYAEFYRRVIQNGERMADVVRALGSPQQTSVVKALDTLNERVRQVTGSRLYSKTMTGDWHSTPLGDEFFHVAERIEHDFEPLARWADDDGVTRLRIAVNSFSFQSLRRIEVEMRRMNPAMKFTNKFINMRSKQVFDKVKHSAFIDVGIGESVVPITSGRQLEVLAISDNRLSLITNFEVPTEAIKVEAGKPIIRRDYFFSLPILLSDTTSFMDYLLILKDGDDARELIDEMSDDEKVDHLKQSYNLIEYTNSVNILMDVLLLGTEHVALIATPEVADHVMAMSDSSLYASDVGVPKKTARRYLIEDGKTRLHKYAMRKQYGGSGAQRPVTDLFWRACLNINIEGSLYGYRGTTLAKKRHRSTTS